MSLVEGRELLPQMVAEANLLLWRLSGGGLTELSREDDQTSL